MGFVENLSLFAVGKTFCKSIKIDNVAMVRVAHFFTHSVHLDRKTASPDSPPSLSVLCKLLFKSNLLQLLVIF